MVSGALRGGSRGAPRPTRRAALRPRPPRCSRGSAPASRRVRREWEGGGGQGAGLCESEPGWRTAGSLLPFAELQRESIERICQREGLELLEVIEELDRSGGDASRPLWNRCIERRSRRGPGACRLEPV